MAPWHSLGITCSMSVFLTVPMTNTEYLLVPGLVLPMSPVSTHSILTISLMPLQVRRSGDAVTPSSSVHTGNWKPAHPYGTVVAATSPEGAWFPSCVRSVPRYVGT